MTVKPKHQRLILIVLSVAALLGAVLLAMWGLQDRAAYFVTPSDIAAGKAQPDKATSGWRSQTPSLRCCRSPDRPRWPGTCRHCRF
jgi:hypothetical protein